MLFAWVGMLIPNTDKKHCKGAAIFIAMLYKSLFSHKQLYLTTSAVVLRANKGDCGQRNTFTDNTATNQDLNVV